jgi:1-deoxy-D-xylulose 5-phosphate reductoisomerase
MCSASLTSRPRSLGARSRAPGISWLQTLDIVREYPQHFQIISLSAGGNVELLAKQVAEFKPSVVGLAAVEKVLVLVF